MDGLYVGDGIDYVLDLLYVALVASIKSLACGLFGELELRRSVGFIKTGKPILAFLLAPD